MDNTNLTESQIEVNHEEQFSVVSDQFPGLDLKLETENSRPAAQSDWETFFLREHLASLAERR